MLIHTNTRIHTDLNIVQLVDSCKGINQVFSNQNQSQTSIVDTDLQLFQVINNIYTKLNNLKT